MGTFEGAAGPGASFGHGAETAPKCPKLQGNHEPQLESRGSGVTTLPSSMLSATTTPSKRKANIAWARVSLVAVEERESEVE